MKKSIWFAFVLLLVACGKEEAKPKPLPVLTAPHMNAEEMLRLVNAARATGYRCGEEAFGPAPALTWNPLLEKSSAAHAQDMAEKNYFAHEALDGSKPADRITRAGYRWSTCGENIAKGQQSIPEVVEAWLKSPGHCKNIMNPAYKHLGASRFVSSWVQNFGSP